ncbi:MAG: SPOR domain-containing protein [Gammaproteobacteria bacterium]|nr:SPOR domain-containing protein [Gammaproteobacteria bacterium]
MARDYKHSRSKAFTRKTRKPVPGWLWLVAGLAIGLFAAFLVWLDKRPADVVGEPPSQAATPASSPAQKEEKEKAKNSGGEKKSPVPAASQGSEQSKPRFDFYTILPEMEVIIPDKELKNRAAPKGAAESYFLQAGSFKNLADADALKANLALLGVEAKIQSVSAGGDTWHRVRLGPYSDLNQLDQARARLRQNNINAIPVKGKG